MIECEKMQKTNLPSFSENSMRVLLMAMYEHSERLRIRKSMLFLCSSGRLRSSDVCNGVS